LNAGPARLLDMKLRDKVLAYLHSCNVLTLATNGEDGPWAAAVFYVNNDFNLFFLSDPATRHVLNINLNPQVAATIQKDYKDWKKIKGIQLEGEVREVTGAKKTVAIARYLVKFPVIGKQTPIEISQAMSKVDWYTLIPSAVYFIDNSLGLGHREKVNLN